MGRALRVGAGFVLAFVVLTCTDERVAGPTRPGALRLDFSGLTAPTASGEPDIPLDSIRVTFRLAGQSVIAYDTTIAPIGPQVQGDSATLLLKVPLDQSPQDFDVTVEAFGAGILWYRLVTTLTIVEGDNPAPAPFTASYVGPGATATRVQVFPADTTAEGGTTVTLRAVVYDASSTPIPGVPVGYRLSDSTYGSITVSYLTATLVGATNVRDSVWLIAETPTHLKDSTRFHLEPPASTLQKVAGDGQNGAIGVPLPVPLTVQVLDALGGPYKRGKVITWAVTAGSANLSTSTTTSDSSGHASVTATPTASGTVTIQASAAGLTAVTFTAGAAAGSIAQVILDRTNDTIPVGDSLQYTATLKDSAGNTVGGVVTWSSTAPAVTNVTSAGLAHALTVGVTSIVAAAGGHADTATLTVSGLASVVVSPADTVITSIGDTVQLSAAGLDNFGDTVPGLTIRFTSATPSVASVNAVTGRVVIIGAGNAVVLARDSVSGLQAASTLRVNQVTFGIQNTPALPDSLQVGVLGQGQIVARALDRRGYPIPGKTIGYSSRNTGIATVNTSGRVAGVALGTTFIADSVDGFKDSVKVAVVTTPPPVIQWAFDSVSVGNGGNLSIALSLTRTDPSPLIVKFTSSDTLIAKTSVKTVTFPSNTANTSVVIQGVAAGRVTIVATDSSGLGYQADSIVVTVVSTIEFRDIGQFFQRTNFYVNQNETYRAQVFLSDPAPQGGLGVTFVYKNGDAVVTPAPAIIPAGQLASDIVITGFTPGTDSVVPTSGGFVGKFSYVSVAANDLAINVPYPYTGVLGVGQSFQPYTSITYSMDHPLIVSASLTPAIGTVPAQDTIPTAQNYAYTTVAATATGQTQFKVTAPGWNADSTTFRFSTPKLVASGATSMIAGNPTKGSWSASTADSLGYGHPVTGALVVTAVSRDTNVVAVDVTVDTIPVGSASATVGSALRAQPGAGGDSTYIVVTAPGYQPDSFKVHVTPPGLSFNHAYPYDGRVGLGMRRVNAAYAQIPYVRPDTFWVIFTHTRAGVIGHTNPDSLAIPAGQTSAYIDIQGDTLGVDTMTITAPGYVVTGSPAIFTVDPIRVRPNSYPTTLYTISAPQQVNAIVVDSANGFAYPLVNPLTVNLTSGNPAAFTLDSTTVTIPAGATVSNYDTLRVVGVDTVGARIFSGAARSSPDSSNLIRVFPTPLNVQLGYPYTVSHGLKLQSNYVYVTGGNAPDTVVVTLSHSNPAAATLPITTVLIPKGQSFSQSFEIQGVDSAGTDTIIATASGYVTGRSTIAVQPSSLIIGNPGTSHQTTDAPSLVSVSTATRSGYGLKPVTPVTYTIASTDRNVIVIDSAVTINAAQDSGTGIVDTSTTTRYFKIRYVGGGTARIIISATGFAPDTTPVITVTGPTLNFGYTTVSLGQGQQLTSQYVYVNNPVTGQPLVVRLSRSDSLLPPANQVFTLSADSVVIAIGQASSPAVTITGQVINSALLIARATGYSQATATVQVTQPRLLVSPQSINLPVGGVPSNVSVLTTDASGTAHQVAADLTVSQLSSDVTVVTGDSASRVIQTGSLSTQFGFTGLKKGAAQVVFSAPGYTPDTLIVQVDTGQLQIVNLPVTLGPNQTTSFQTYVQLPYNVSNDVTVNLSSSDPSTLQVSPASVVIPTGSYYAYFDLTGVALGTATITATSVDAKPVTSPIVRVSTPRLFLGLSSSVIAGGHNAFYVSTNDSLGVSRIVTAEVTVSIGSDKPSHTQFDSTPIHVAPGDQSANSGVVFDTAGTYVVVAAAPGYTSDTVVVTVGGAFVIIGDNFFAPDTVTISVGNYVTWFNASSVGAAHTSTSDTGVWNSGNILAGNTFQRIFITAGTFPYHCTIHGVSMAGTVIVTP